MEKSTLHHKLRKRFCLFMLLALVDILQYNISISTSDTLGINPPIPTSSNIYLAVNKIHPHPHNVYSLSAVSVVILTVLLLTLILRVEV